MSIIESKVYTNAKYVTSELNDITIQKISTIPSQSLVSREILKRKKYIIDSLKMRKWYSL